MAVVLPKRIGWVGLGAMGWPMANQLLKSSSANLVIFDVDEPLLHRFSGEAPDGRVQIVACARQVADESVRMPDSECAPRLISNWTSGLYLHHCPGRQPAPLYLNEFGAYLSTGNHVKEVYLTAETGLLAGNTAEKIFIDW